MTRKAPTLRLSTPNGILFFREASDRKSITAPLRYRFWENKEKDERRCTQGNVAHPGGFFWGPTLSDGDQHAAAGPRT